MSFNGIREFSSDEELDTGNARVFNGFSDILLVHVPGGLREHQFSASSQPLALCSLYRNGDSQP